LVIIFEYIKIYILKILKYYELKNLFKLELNVFEGSAAKKMREHKELSHHKKKMLSEKDTLVPHPETFI